MALPAPKNARWTRDGNRAITIEWDAVAGAKSYGIQVQYGGDSNTPRIKWRAIRGTRYRFSGMKVNFGFRYRIFASKGDTTVASQNSSYSNWTPWFYTTPASITRFSTSGKSGIGDFDKRATLSWSLSGIYYPTGVQVQRKNKAGQVVDWFLGTGTGGRAPTTFTDENPSGEAIQYRVRPYVGAETPAGRRVFGAWTSWSSALDYLWRPNPPRLSTPVGYYPAWEDLTFQWMHAPNDGSPQQEGEVRWRPVGYTSWNWKATYPAHDDEFFTWHDGEGPGDWEWQARTRGAAGWEGRYDWWSQWAPAQTFTTINRPVVTITKPSGDSSRVTVQWSVTQAQGIPQSGALVRLWGDSRRTQLLESKTVRGSATSVAFEYRLSNNTQYWVEVDATCGISTRPTAVTAFTTKFLPPPRPIVSGVWNDVMGAYEVNVSPGEVVEGTKPTVSFNLQVLGPDRRWKWTAMRIPAEGGTYYDFESPVAGNPPVMAYANTAEQVQATARANMQGESGAFWLASGNDLTVPVPFRVGSDAPPGYGVQPERERSTEEYVGREWPVAYVGESKRRRFSLSGVLVEGWDTQLDAVESLIYDNTASHFLRTPDGRTAWVSLGATEFARNVAGLWEFSVVAYEVGGSS